MDIINWIMEHWLEMLGAATSLVTAASLVTRWTDTPADDRVVGKIYKVIEAIAQVTGKAKQLPGQGSKKVSKTPILFLPLLMLVLGIGCAANLTPRERAQATGYEVGQAYHELYQNYRTTDARLQQVGKKTMPVELAKSMDALKRAVIAYNDMVIIWADTNSTGTPAGLDILGSDIVRLIADISTTLMQFKEE